MTPVEVGSLVRVRGDRGSQLGLVLAREMYDGIFKDSGSLVPVYRCEVLWDSDPPTLREGTGSVRWVPEDVLEVVT